MDIPIELLGAVVGEGEKYFFTVDCPIGIQDHIHICIKKKNRLLLFSTCSSQTDTAFRLAKLKCLDLNTFPGWSGGIFVISHKGTKILSHYKSISYKVS